MPIDYQIDLQRRRIRTTCSGWVTLDDVLAHFDLLENDPQCPPQLDVLLDLTTVTSLPEPFQLRSVAERIGAVTKVAFGLCAIVTSSDVLFGLSRMFEVYSQAYFEQTCVFRHLAEGAAWLDAVRKRGNTEPT